MILKVKHKNNYTVIPNQVFQELTDGLAIGILTFMLSKPNDWQVNKQFCYKHFKQGRTQVDNAFKELQRFGYVYKQQGHEKGTGKFNGWTWIVTDQPKPSDTGVSHRSTENRPSENRLTENRPSEIVQQLSKDILSKEVISKEELINGEPLNFEILLKIIRKYTRRDFRVINSKTKKAYKKLLRDGYTKEMIKNAIVNATQQKHHIENNNQYLTPEFFSRSKTIDTYGIDGAKTKQTKSEYNAAG